MFNLWVKNNPVIALNFWCTYNLIKLKKLFKIKVKQLLYTFKIVCLNKEENEVHGIHVHRVGQ